MVNTEYRVMNTVYWVLTALDVRLRIDNWEYLTKNRRKGTEEREQKTWGNGIRMNIWSWRSDNYSVLGITYRGSILDLINKRTIHQTEFMAMDYYFPAPSVPIYPYILVLCGFLDLRFLTLVLFPSFTRVDRKNL